MTTASDATFEAARRGLQECNAILDELFGPEPTPAEAELAAKRARAAVPMRYWPEDATVGERGEARESPA